MSKSPQRGQNEILKTVNNLPVYERYRFCLKVMCTQFKMVTEWSVVAYKLVRIARGSGGLVKPK